MQKILFIGHPYHQKTKSSKFFSDLLETQFRVDYCDAFDDESKIGKPKLSSELKNNSVYDSVIFWQIKPNKSLIANIQYKKLFFFPMYDACGQWQIEKWAGLYKCHIICFSKTLYNQLCDYGFYASYFQYFPYVSDFIDNYGDLESCFHWFRRAEIKTSIVSKLVPTLKKVHIHQAPDPCFSVSDNQIPLLNITHTEWFDSKHDLNNTIKNSAFYLCPRLQEGIGMSFLEAMAQARCVIAPNIPTMNEYIQHKVTGLLYDIHNPQAFDITIDDIHKIQSNTHQYMQNGYQQWNVNKQKLLELIKSEQKIPPRPVQFYKHILWRLLKNPFKIKRLWHELQNGLHA